ncbi:TraB/GumN family protein [Brevibacillus gelatini]
MNKKKRWSKFFRWAGAGVLSLSILLGQVYPVYANTPLSTPSVSPWAVSTLNEGEKYGIFPLKWYQDEAFLQPISADRFAELMKATEKKLDSLGLQKKAAAVSIPQEKVITRETVMTTLYKLLAQYELPAAFEMTGQDPLTYLQKKGLVQGMGAGLALRQPATVEQAVVLASRVVEFAYDTAGSGATGLMWKVTNGKNTLYLLGSVHLGMTDMYPLKKSIRDAFEASDDLWVEADIIGGDMDYMTEKMMYSDGTTLKDHISAETYSKLQKVLASLGLPENSFDTMKPFAVTLSLPTFGYVSDSAEDREVSLITGIDSYFLTKAMLADKPIHELEGIKLQTDLLSNVPAEQQEKELNTMLDSILSGEQPLADQGKILRDMQRDWVEGDLEGLTNTLTAYGQFGAGEVNQRLLGERDRNMASKLAQLLEQEGEHTSFIVIGSAHYALKGMVLDQLKEKGYDIQRMK